MQDVLVMAERFDSWCAGAAYAADIARTLDGSLTGTYLMPSTAPAYDFAPATLVSEMIEICREQSEAALRAGAAFRRWASERGVRASGWHVADGDLVDVLQAAACWHDLVVLERGEHMPWTLAGQVLLAVDVPCILVPQGCETARCDTVAVAWDGSLRAARALHGALPLLQRARSVLLIDGAEQGAHPGSASVEPYLAEHGIAATRLRIEPDGGHGGEEILGAANNAGADLLVMGCYGRTRFSEWLFGGATRHVLQRATLPVLMRH